mmetsp:Transcript_92183/g.176749  ORF Transcript_92183/g.176749 Transcript_92183/m.176749 type:complete len:268 (-) Transcript_92183:96-899(-)
MVLLPETGGMVPSMSFGMVPPLARGDDKRSALHSKAVHCASGGEVRPVLDVQLLSGHRLAEIQASPTWLGSRVKATIQEYLAPTTRVLDLLAEGHSFGDSELVEELVSAGCGAAGAQVLLAVLGEAVPPGVYTGSYDGLSWIDEIDNDAASALLASECYEPCTTYVLTIAEDYTFSLEREVLHKYATRVSRRCLLPSLQPISGRLSGGELVFDQPLQETMAIQLDENNDILLLAPVETALSFEGQLRASSELRTIKLHQQVRVLGLI